MYLNHEQNGIATYAKGPELIMLVNSEITSENIFHINILYGNLTIINVYNPRKPTDPPLPYCLQPALIAGDLNSVHTEWGYRTNDKAGEKLNNWANQNNLHLLYNPQDKGTFFSARWQKEYTPDLVFVTEQEGKSAMQARLEALNNFPSSQHRPILITTGLKIPAINSLPKLRWNF